MYGWMYGCIYVYVCVCALCMCTITLRNVVCICGNCLSNLLRIVEDSLDLTTIYNKTSLAIQTILFHIENCRVFSYLCNILTKDDRKHVGF